MRAKDIMTAPVITAGPDSSVSEIAALLFERRISAVPVVEEGRLVGIVSEGDLLHRHEIGTERGARPGSWWLRLFSAGHSAEGYIKSHARKARDVMTREVVSVAPDSDAAEIASLLEAHGIKRVPVLEGGRLVGVVSRANLVQALAGVAQAAVRVTPPSDQSIRSRLLAELQSQPWWRRGTFSLEVKDGRVTYRGIVDSAEERDAARVAAENIPGVRAVQDLRRPMRDLPSMV